MTTTGTVRSWAADDGYGVVDSPDTPGGCWTHFSVVAVVGHKSLEPGQLVSLEWEPGAQDGYAYRAVRTWPLGQLPVDAHVEPQASTAYTSELTVMFDDDGST